MFFGADGKVVCRSLYVVGVRKERRESREKRERRERGEKRTKEEREREREERERAREREEREREREKKRACLGRPLVIPPKAPRTGLAVYLRFLPLVCLIFLSFLFGNQSRPYRSNNYNNNIANSNNVNNSNILHNTQQQHVHHTPQTHTHTHTHTHTRTQDTSYLHITCIHNAPSCFWNNWL